MIRKVKHAFIRGSFSLFCCLMSVVVFGVIYQRAPLIDLVLLGIMGLGNGIFAVGNLTYAVTADSDGN